MGIADIQVDLGIVELNKIKYILDSPSLQNYF